MGGIIIGTFALIIGGVFALLILLLAGSVVEALFMRDEVKTQPTPIPKLPWAINGRPATELEVVAELQDRGYVLQWSPQQTEEK